MSLTRYQRKRDFQRTPEPKGAVHRQTAGSGRFVVQKHAASHLHYDFRLELDGVLKSWAVPKGPSLDPAIKALAVEVEDHPLEYGNFEGIIPQGQYGGGTVMVWDRGTWEPDEEPQRAYRRGKLSFRLHGEKLHGGWTLVRMRGGKSDGKPNWLLIKRDDDEARVRKDFDLLTEAPQSVLSGREMQQIAKDADQVWSTQTQHTPARTARSPRARLHPDPAALPGARVASLPRTFQPQLATLSSRIPAGKQWLHEVKLDGYRIVAIVRQGRIRLLTRSGGDWSKRFAPVVRAVEALKLDHAILDGEVVRLNDEGKSDFQLLQNWLNDADRGGELVYYVFDLPYLSTADLTRTPLSLRKEALAQLLRWANPANSGVLRYHDHLGADGPTVFEHACRLGLEGIVSKQIEGPYAHGRTRSWLKTKCVQRQEFLIGGFTRPTGSRAAFGALLLGYYAEDDLVYCGRVGTGFSDASLRHLHAELLPKRTAEPPFAKPPGGAAARGVTWVKPDLVCEVEFTQWTDDGLLRHPSFHGLREDKAPHAVRRESQASPGAKRKRSAPSVRAGTRAAVSRVRRSSTAKGASMKRSDTVAGVRITHGDRVLYPGRGLTKLDLAEFYAGISDWILPHLVDRPLTLVRCPQGQAGECFYQKNWPAALPRGIKTVSIREKTKRTRYVVIEDATGLISLIQFGALELHPWPARVKHVEQPDRLVFDLDPAPEVNWREVVAAARELRQRLTTVGLKSFVRTTGGKGLHIVAPLAGPTTWDDLKQFAKSVAEEMAATQPDKYVATMSKLKRQGKIFVDYLRNQRGATAVASYSTRARPGAPVATPLRWSELTARLRPDKYDVTNLPKRLAGMDDPWQGFFTLRQTLAVQK